MKLRVSKSLGHACSLNVLLKTLAHHSYLKFQGQNAAPFPHTFSWLFAEEVTSHFLESTLHVYQDGMVLPPHKIG